MIVCLQKMLPGKNPENNAEGMETEIWKVKNDLIMKEIKALLEAQKSVSIYVRGGSMRPFLREGDKVTLMPAGEWNIKKGMIVLARVHDRMILHRVTNRKAGRICLMGDANARQRERVGIEDVWGVVSDAYRGGGEIELYSCRMCTAVWLWTLLRPLRGGLLRVYDWWEKKKDKR